MEETEQLNEGEGLRELDSGIFLNKTSEKWGFCEQSFRIELIFTKKLLTNFLIGI